MSRLIAIGGLIAVLVTASVFAQQNSQPRIEQFQQTRFGILYSLWQCLAYDDTQAQPADISKSLTGRMPWAPVPSFEWWSEPALGYYCLSRREDILRNHAEMLRDAGVNFVILDISNWPDTHNANAETAIIQPLGHLLSVWSQISNAPKVVAWAPLTADGDMFEYVLHQLKAYPNLQFPFYGKPLALVVANPAMPVDGPKYVKYSQLYTLRRMWGLSQPPSNWSFMEQCAPGFLSSHGTARCNQRVTRVDGRIEQIPITTAYQETYMSLTTTAVPKFHGRTFVRQFETAFEHPEAPIVTVTGWNEWIAQRFCLSSPGSMKISSQNCDASNDHWADGNKIFVDQYNAEYSRDIEPSKEPPGAFYYRLLRDCVADFRKGERCSIREIDRK